MLSIPSPLRFLSLFLGICIFILPPGVTGAADKTDLGCIGCHTTRGLSMRLPSGEILSLTIDAAELGGSIHGTLHCTECHSSIKQYPHPKISADDHRDLQIESSKQCQPCHAPQFKQELNSNHARAMAGGNLSAAVCIDCHGSHSVIRPTLLQNRISTVCGRCHGAIYEQYNSSVHGKALLENGNPDVPVCNDCHPAHTSEDPGTEEFRLKSPKLCAKCHADARLMRKYGISPDVFNTYVADFHGMTVTIFEKKHLDQRVNTAVCTDCHSVHDIQKVSEANPTVVKENLLNSCRRCHPDANVSFPDSWVGHFPPTKDRYPLVYYVTLFYKLLIPITIGGMVLFVLIDASSRIIRRVRRKRI